ncbi:MAG TPA: OsmC family protein [Cerasibacillus sp.]|uniref:OsmC family protein n=1 Tax=Cerasibacillus sp. TaxID=2498711 RepID=UPI002F3F9DA5
MEFKMKENGMSVDLEYGTLHVSGNSELGFRPFQLLVASITTCSSMVFRRILEKQRITIDDLRVKAQVTRNPDEANRIEHIELIFVVTGKNLNEKKLAKNLALARKNCAMVRSVEESINIEESLEFIHV